MPALAAKIYDEILGGGEVARFACKYFLRLPQIKII
jgi:hypothetical protein